MARSKFFKNTVLYFVLILGYIYLYVIDIDTLIYPNEGNEVKSKVEFIYQQF